MASKLVTDRQRSAEAVAAIGDAQGETLTAAVAASLARGRRDVGTDLDALLEMLTGRLLAARDAMVAADATHEKGLSDDPAARAAHGEAAANLYGDLVDLRDITSGSYGPELASALFGGPTPRDPVVLQRFGHEVAEQLLVTAFPAARQAGVSLDRAAAANMLREKSMLLATQLEAVAREEREAQVTLVEKNRAIDAYDRVFQGVSTVLTGLFILAGQDELAERVRPSARRPGLRADDEPDPADIAADEA